MWRDTFCNPSADIYPFRFTYNGQSSESFLQGWKRETIIKKEKTYSFTAVTFIEPGGPLRVRAEIKQYFNAPAADWQLFMENKGWENTAIIEEIDSVYLWVNEKTADRCYYLHSAYGGLSTKNDFSPRTEAIHCLCSRTLRTAGGRSTNDANAYFTVESGEGNILCAIGWTGQWKCDFIADYSSLHVRGGLEDCRFYLEPGEKIALPSVLALFCNEDTEQASSQFRRLVLEEYVPCLPGRDKAPYLFCNTCFTRGGGWLDECNAENQISLINALQPLGCEFVITDAGWYPGGWNSNLGSWYPDPLRYPQGMEPVTAAAAKQGMGYGLWFELERVTNDSQLAQEHPEYVLHNRYYIPAPGEREYAIANLCNPACVEHLYQIVHKMLSIPQFACYRQDFNYEPLDIWRSNDQPDRKGITEIFYINGLYAFLDKIRANFPHVFLNGCASGGRRLDLEMIKRFHTHQTTDFWFNNTVDQNTQLELARYLPNTCFTSHINRYDDYTMASVMGASLCLGWIADSNEGWQGIPPFRFERATSLLARYKEVRQYLNDAFYPLTKPDATEEAITAAQYWNNEKQEGVVLVYRRGTCQQEKIILALKRLKQETNYRLTDLESGAMEQHTGKQLQAFPVTLLSACSARVLKVEAIKE